MLESPDLAIESWSMLVASTLLVRCSEGVRCSLHLNEPGWVVGEQRQLVLVMLVWRDSPPKLTAAALSMVASISVLSFIISNMKYCKMNRSYPCLCLYGQFKIWISFKAQQISLFCLVITRMMMHPLRTNYILQLVIMFQLLLSLQATSVFFLCLMDDDDPWLLLRSIINYTLS